MKRNTGAYLAGKLLKFLAALTLLSLPYHVWANDAVDSVVGNGVFDFKLKTPGPASSDTCFSCTQKENHALNFSIFQKDPRLSDLFDSDGHSELCFPTALAESLAYLYHYKKPRYSNLKLAGLSPDGNVLDGIQLVHHLFVICRTDRHKGTQLGNDLRCTLQVLKESGYKTGDSALITWRNIENSSDLPIEHRALKIDDVLKYVGRGDAVILKVGWYVSEDDGTWHRKGGHSIGIYGYDYSELSPNEIILRVINPETEFKNDGRYLNYSLVKMQKVGVEDVVGLFPANGSYTLTGPGFNGRKYPVIEGLMHFVPDRLGQ